MEQAHEARERPYPMTSWRMPPLSTMYLCDDGYYRSLGDMLDGLGEDEVPHSERDLTLLLDIYGVDWTRPITYEVAQRDEALRRKWVRDEATHHKWTEEREACVGIPEMPDYPDQITGAM